MGKITFLNSQTFESDLKNWIELVSKSKDAL